MCKTIHVCQSIEGALKNWNKGTWFALARDNAITIDEVKQYFLDAHRAGKKVLPMTDPPCEGFSYQTGCPGHEKKESLKDDRRSNN